MLFKLSLEFNHNVFYLCSFESSPRHDSFVPKFEAELAHFCERLVSFSSPTTMKFNVSLV